jgi:hypothetical protein
MLIEITRHADLARRPANWNMKLDVSYDTKDQLLSQYEKLG